MANVTDPRDTRVLTPRLRRALENPVGSGGTEAGLSDEQLNAIAADAIASVIFYSSSLFGHKLEVAERDAKYLAPIAWRTDVALQEHEITAITAQAALDFFFGLLSDGLTGQTISDEASSWAWEKSPQALVERLRQLKSARDQAIEILEQESDSSIVDWVSFIGGRDEVTARIVEPFTKGDPSAYNDPLFERETAFMGESEQL